MGSRSVQIVEVAPRDGLQNVDAHVATADKVEFVERLAAAGVTSLEVTSFVRPDRVPQLSDADQVASVLARRSDLRLIALVANGPGLERALRAGLREIAVFAAVTESFSQANLNAPVDEALRRFREVAAEALAGGLRVRGYASPVLGCPFEGHVERSKVRAVVEELLAMGCHEVSLGDTIGVGTRSSMLRLLDEVGSVVALDRLAVHCHDTYGQGLANSLAALDAGVATIDASAGGLGGCPFAGRGATGNLATEDLVYALESEGVETGIDLTRLTATTAWLHRRLGHEPSSRAAVALQRRRHGAGPAAARPDRTRSS